MLLCAPDFLLLDLCQIDADSMLSSCDPLIIVSLLTQTHLLHAQQMLKTSCMMSSITVPLNMQRRFSEGKPDTAQSISTGEIYIGICCKLLPAL